MISACLDCWTKFWFAPSPKVCLRKVRLGLAIVAAIYFLSAMSDLSVWYVAGSPASSRNLAEFFRTAELAADARWMVSPLFFIDAIFVGGGLSENIWVYRTYLSIGVVLALSTVFAERLAKSLPSAIGRLVEAGGLSVLLWLWFVGWANRVVLLAGIVEPLLAVSLAAIAIAPISMTSRELRSNATSWRTTLSCRLLACQATLVGAITSATMLASPTWWNGTGAYALVAPAEDRLVDVRGSFFETPLVYEPLTFLIVLILPLGILLAWHNHASRYGVLLLIVWSLLVGFLAANVLYCATFAIIATTLGPLDTNHAPAGANGAETLDGGGME